MCHILRTSSGSSHTNNHEMPGGQVTLAVLNTSQKIFMKVDHEKYKINRNAMS